MLPSVSPRLHTKVPIHNVSNHLQPSEKNVSHNYISDYAEQRRECLKTYVLEKEAATGRINVKNFIIHNIKEGGKGT